MTNVWMDYETAYNRVVHRVDEILFKAPLIIRTYTSHLSKARGKFIRTHAVLSCAMNETNQVHKDAVTFAASIEILHLATLVHDDVMDEADVRRGIETVQKKFGRKTAVICGDYLLSAALKEAANAERKKEYEDYYLPNYVDRIAIGELRQHLNNGNLSLSMYRYFSIINGKTAALFEASYYAGAILSEMEEKRMRLYRNLGRYVGMIFQLTDDCIDFEENEKEAKKNVQSDYEQGVITLPLIYTLEKDRNLRSKAEKKSLTREEINTSVLKAGGIPFTKGVSKRYYKKAERIIETLQLSDEKEERLRKILDKAYYGLKMKG